jgi:hypothetical protein
MAWWPDGHVHQRHEEELHHPQHPRARPAHPWNWWTARFPTWTAPGRSPRWATAAARLQDRVHLNYGFSSSTLAALVGPVFDKIAGSLVDAFVKRADQVYGA